MKEEVRVAHIGKTLILTSTFQKIKEKLNIVDVVSRYTPLKQRGSSGKYVGLCPLHTETTPSFHVDENLGLFYCFGCMKGGTVIDFIRYAENLDLPEIPHFVERVFGIKVTEENTASFWKKFFDVVYEFNDKGFVANYLKERFKKKINEAEDYFFYIKPDKIREFLSRFSDSELKEMEYYKIYNSERNVFFFEHRIFAPIEDYTGKVVGISGRTTIPRKITAKYMHSKFLSNKALPLISLARKVAKSKKTKKVFITEGIFDALAFIAAGYPAIALLGVNLSDEKISVLEREFDEFYIVLDSDASGINNMHKIAHYLVKSNRMANTKFVHLPKGKDPDELFAEHGDNFLEEVLKKTYSLEDEFINSFYYIAYNATPVKTKENLKRELVRRILPELTNYKNSAIEYSVLVRLSERTGYTITHLLENLDRVNNANKIRAYQELKNISIHSLSVLEQRILSTYIKLGKDEKQELLKLLRFYSTLFSKEFMGLLVGSEDEDQMNLEVVKFFAVNILPPPFSSIDEIKTALEEKKKKDSSVEKILKIAQKLKIHEIGGKENEQPPKQLNGSGDGDDDIYEY